MSDDRLMLADSDENRAFEAESSEEETPSRRGWHGDPEGHAAAGRKGGRAAHARGTAHRFTPEEAREAGRKGGMTSKRSKPA